MRNPRPKPESPLGGLSPRQLRFVEHYLKFHNGKAAAKHAGYTAKNLEVCACQVLSAANVHAALQAAYRKNIISAETVLARLAEQAMANPMEFVTANGKAKPKAMAGRGYLLKRVKKVKGGVDLELHDPQKALELVGKHLGMFKESVEVSGPGGAAPYVFHIQLNQGAVDSTGPKEKEKKD